MGGVSNGLCSGKITLLIGPPFLTVFFVVAKGNAMWPAEQIAERTGEAWIYSLFTNFLRYENNGVKGILVKTSQLSFDVDGS